jgi:hypothetical protein
MQKPVMEKVKKRELLARDLVCDYVYVLKYEKLERHYINQAQSIPTPIEACKLVVFKIIHHVGSWSTQSVPKFVIVLPIF